MDIQSYGLRGRRSIEILVKVVVRHTGLLNVGLARQSPRLLSQFPNRRHPPVGRTSTSVCSQGNSKDVGRLGCRKALKQPRHRMQVTPYGLRSCLAPASRRT